MVARVSASLSLALALAFAPVSAQALVTFDFFWSGEVGVNGVVSSGDESLRAVGTVGIDANPGESFDETDFTLVNILVTGDDIAAFIIDGFGSSDVAGTVDAGGGFASFSLAPAPFVFGAGRGFGCENLLCGGGLVFVASDVDRFVTYISPEAAAASFTMTAPTAAVPLPAALPLAGAALAGLALLRGRRRG